MENTLLWRITPPDDAPVSYLFGTMHVRDQRAFGWLELALLHLQQCEVFAAEFDFAEIDPAEFAQNLYLPEGQTLDRQLKPGAWKNLSRLAQKKLSLPPEIAARQHPMSLTAALTAAMMAEEAPQSLDETLWQQAKLLDKTITGMETFASQLDTMRRIPMEAHLKNLVWLSKNYARQKKRVKKMLSWYKAGDVQQLFRAAKKDAKGMRKVLLYDRNKVMARRFLDLAAQQPLFCAVGAGHLAGEKGMLRLLKKAGWKVARVCNARNDG